ncbi:MAG: helix-turn-helix transcriptional regulator [Mycobacterium sp.]|nr:helix-turn-helix transcriptional regulator [Mycobacterium sp.]
MAGYGQFCPMAKAMEVLDERWTILVVRELLAGSCHFNDLRRGVPKMSPALLSKRLKSLARAGIVARTEVDGRACYRLTRSGQELRGVVEALNAWGARWVGTLGEEDLDPHLLMWDIRRTVVVDAWPRTRTVLEIRLDGVAPRTSRWWLVVSHGQVDLCDFDPGHEVTAQIDAGLRALTQIWRGDTSWERALHDGDVRITGPAAVRRAVPSWIGQGAAAAVPRPATGYSGAGRMADGGNGQMPTTN